MYEDNIKNKTSIEHSSPLLVWKYNSDAKYIKKSNVSKELIHRMLIYVQNFAYRVVCNAGFSPTVGKQRWLTKP